MSGRKRSPQPSCFWLPRRINMAPRTRTQLPAPPRAQARSPSSAASESVPRQDAAQRSTRPPPPPTSASSQTEPGGQTVKRQPWRSQEKVNSSTLSIRKSTNVQTSLGAQLNPPAPTLTRTSSRTKSPVSSAPGTESPTREASLVDQAKVHVDEPEQSAHPSSPKELKPTANTNISLPHSIQKLPAETSAASSSGRTKSGTELSGFAQDAPDIRRGTEGEEQVEHKRLGSAPGTHQATSPARKNGSDNERNGNCSTGKERKIVVSAMPRASFSDGDRAPFGKEINEGLSRLAQQISVGRHEQREQQPVNVVTLAGKSKGASMTVGHDPVKYRGDEALRNIINSNVETINNSTLHGSTCNVGDPGVHFNILTKPTEILNTKAEAAAPKAERAGSNKVLNQTPNQEPRVRRRCLRALFMESSDSDPENPRKPRRHGCRYSCEDKKKSKDHDGRTSTADTMREQHIEATSRA